MKRRAIESLIQQYANQVGYCWSIGIKGNHFKIGKLWFNHDKILVVINYDYTKEEFDPNPLYLNHKDVIYLRREKIKHGD